MPACLVQNSCLLSGPALCWRLRLHLTKDTYTLEARSVSLAHSATLRQLYLGSIPQILMSLTSGRPPSHAFP